MKVVRMWYTHQTQHEGGGACHLGLSNATSNKTLCGRTHPMMTSGEPFEFDRTVPDLAGECLSCQRSAIRIAKRSGAHG